MPRISKKKIEVLNFSQEFLNKEMGAMEDRKITHKEMHKMPMTIELASRFISFYANKAFPKYDETIEVHIKINGIDPKNTEHNVRGYADMPNGLGSKKPIILALVEDPHQISLCASAGADYAGFEDIISEMKLGRKMDADVCVTHPSFMPKIASEIGKILGPKGLMPNHKLGTISEDVPAAIKKITAGQSRFRSDKFGVVHCIIGTIKMGEEKIANNLKALIRELSKFLPTCGSIGECVITTTQAPFSIKLLLQDDIT